MKELIEASKVKPVIDKCYPLREAAEAFRYFGEGHAKGKVVITVEDAIPNAVQWQAAKTASLERIIQG